jgi:ClpP class serine protease
MYINLRNSLDNETWEMTVPNFHLFRTKLDEAIKHSADYVTNGSNDNSNVQTDGSGLLYVPVCGDIVKGTGLSQDACNLINVTDLDYLNQTIRDAQENPSIDTVLFDFDTCGGSPHSHTTFQLIQELSQTKNVIGYSDGNCLSAGYHIAAACDEFYISETATVGSIGSVFARVDLTAANKDAGIAYTFFSSSPKKLYMNPNVEMTDEEAEWIEERLMYSYEIFRSDVLANRDIPEEALDASIFYGAQAVETNLADGIVQSVQDLADNLE